ERPRVHRRPELLPGEALAARESPRVPERRRRGCPLARDIVGRDVRGDGRAARPGAGRQGGASPSPAAPGAPGGGREGAALETLQPFRTSLPWISPRQAPVARWRS